MNLYEILGVAACTTRDDIKLAYRHAAKTKHPDVGGSKEEFEQIKLAYDVLSDPERRKRYDESGETEQAQIIDERGEMYATLATMVFEVIQQIDPRTNDIVAAVRKHIVSEQEKLKQDLPRFQKLRQAAQTCADRIINQAPDSTDNPLKSAVLNRLLTMDAQMKTAQQSIEMGDRMLAFLSTYQYKVDSPYAAQSQLWGNGFLGYNQQDNHNQWAAQQAPYRP